jgi:hypothetical protein
MVEMGKELLCHQKEEKHYISKTGTGAHPSKVQGK